MPNQLTANPLETVLNPAELCGFVKNSIVELKVQPCLMQFLFGLLALLGARAESIHENCRAHFFWCHRPLVLCEADRHLHLLMPSGSSRMTLSAERAAIPDPDSKITTVLAKNEKCASNNTGLAVVDFQSV